MIREKTIEKRQREENVKRSRGSYVCERKEIVRRKAENKLNGKAKRVISWNAFLHFEASRGVICSLLNLLHNVACVKLYTMNVKRDRERHVNMIHLLIFFKMEEFSSYH